MAPASTRPAQWDLFCRIVDNFGDAGVAWRLAVELATEHDLAVTLWIDDPGALARLVPALDPDTHDSSVHGVRVRRLAGAALPTVRVADVIVEMFGAGVPDGYVAAMASTQPRPQWFVLEYLSAEPWVDAHHGLPSPHPRWPLVRRFWFPGFTAATGGLLRERDLVARRERFMRDPDAACAMLRELGVVIADEALRISLFCYPGAPVATLFEALSRGARPVSCLVPGGVADAAVDAWCSSHGRRDGVLQVHRIPFVPQVRYDELLWSCDVNFVRGEDSFVRAQWAARPFAWQAYPQADAAHFAKLAAFLGRYLEGCDIEAAAALRAFWASWNVLPGADDPATAWSRLMPHLPNLNAHARTWAARIAALPELAASLIDAALDRV